jgi:hypothetical protein
MLCSCVVWATLQFDPAAPNRAEDLERELLAWGAALDATARCGLAALLQVQCVRAWHWKRAWRWKRERTRPVRLKHPSCMYKVPGGFPTPFSPCCCSWRLVVPEP